MVILLDFSLAMVRVQLVQHLFLWPLLFKKRQYCIPYVHITEYVLVSWLHLFLLLFEPFRWYAI
jgi:hypothetical protein